MRQLHATALVLSIMAIMAVANARSAHALRQLRGADAEETAVAPIPTSITPPSYLNGALSGTETSGTYDLVNLQKIKTTIATATITACVPANSSEPTDGSDASPSNSTGSRRSLLQSGSSTTMQAGYCLSSQGCLVSPNRRYSICMQRDGNIVLYDGPGTKAIWASGTEKYSATGPFRLCMQTDGNLVGYNSRNQAIWASGTQRSGSGSYYMAIQNDGNLVVYDRSNQALWNTNTWGGTGPASFIIVGGGNQDLFVSCNTRTWRCVGTKSRDQSAGWVWESNNRIRLARSDLCLNVWGGGSEGGGFGSGYAGDVNLFNCDPVVPNAQWKSDGPVWAPEIKTFKNQNLWWDGEKQLIVVKQCFYFFGAFAWQCQWRTRGI